MINTIKKLLFLACLCGIALFSTTVFNRCENPEITEIDNETELNVILKSDSVNSGKLIDLVKRQIKPFTIANASKTLDSIARAKGYTIPDDFELKTTHYFVRFLPKSKDEFDFLDNEVDAGLIDNSINVEIISEGRYYLENTESENINTWQYTVVPIDFKFPKIEYEILEDLFLDDETNETRVGMLTHPYFYYEYFGWMPDHDLFPHDNLAWDCQIGIGYEGPGNPPPPPPDIYNLSVMTYNLGPKRKKKIYDKLAKVIKDSGADVAAVQEVRGTGRFIRLMNKTGMRGYMCVTIPGAWFWDYGIGMLYKKSLGTPLISDVRLLSTIFEDTDPFRAYIVAVFSNYCVIATHYSLYSSDQQNMTNSIINHPLVATCHLLDKPVYVAGDLNPKSDSTAINLFRNSGFKILNNMEKDQNGVYKYPTRGSGMPDLILEYNNNPNKELINRYRPTTDYISDHLPYLVKVKYK